MRFASALLTLIALALFPIRSDAQMLGVNASPHIFYVDCNGNDTNNGLTPATPVLTFTQAHTLASAVGGGLTVTIYIRGKSYSGGGACTYAPSTNIIGANSNEWWIGYPPDGPRAALIQPTIEILGCGFCTNIRIENLTFDGTNAPGVAHSNLFQFYSLSATQIASNIYIRSDTFQNIKNTAFQFYDMDDLYIQGNTFTNVGVTDVDDSIAFAISLDAAEKKRIYDR